MTVSITGCPTSAGDLPYQGRLALDDPVQKYSDFKLPDNYTEPIRIIDLMNHTPGFEDRLIGLSVQDEKRKQPLKVSVSRNIPRRVRPPNTEVSYSNYGTMLAGYIVERIEKPHPNSVGRNVCMFKGRFHEFSSPCRRLVQYC